ncbi:MAG: adenylate/guanylate cyclase domain-containing protein [Desulfamplus sp.]|nr:adenylate/guanylate cyclase domain-containing protein [Desulfamplus sp.]
MEGLEREGKSKKLKLPVIASGLLITILTTTLYISDIEFLRLIDNRLYDLCIKIVFTSNSNIESLNDNGKENSKKSYTSAIVDIDEYSLRTFGQWPWSRYHIAKLLHKIDDAGAASVGIDILFSEPDRTSLIEIQKALKNEFNIDVTFSNLPASASDSNIDPLKLMDNDIFLAQAINQTSSTLGYYFNFNSNSLESRKQNFEYNNNSLSYLAPLSTNLVFESGSKPSDIFGYLFKAVDAISPISVLSNKETNTGFMNTLADSDGFLRRTPLFISWNETIYPQLALSTLLNSNDESHKINFSNPTIKISSNGVEAIKFNNTSIHLDRKGSILLNYRGPAYTFPYISAGKILENDFRKEDLKGKIIFLGSSAAGLKDIRMSPLDHNFPGVEVHATIVDNIIKGDFILKPDWTSALEVLLTILCGIVATFSIGWAGAWLILILTISLSTIIFTATVWGVITNHIWVSPLFPLLALMLNFSILNLVKYGLSEKDKKFYRSAFSHYVSKSVVNQIIESPETFNLEGEEKEITIFFSDIRNFTSISETLSPSQVSRLLHNYFTPVTRMIIDHKGTLDKFIGDAIMCFWNAPINIENHKELALNAAMKILKTLEELSISFEKEYGVKIKTGIGLHSGICRVGNMGSAELFDYTAIGDHVNITSRLEGLTKFYGVDIIFSENMIPNKVENILVQYVDRVRVKGKTEPLNIYTAHSVKTNDDFSTSTIQIELENIKIELEQYHHAIEQYKNRDFKGAFEIFSELDETKRGRKKLYSIYKKRAWEFMNDPPDKRWDRVFNHSSK